MWINRAKKQYREKNAELQQPLVNSGVRFSNGKKKAVSIAYVGGLPEHAELAPKLLRELDIQATFYIDPTEVLESSELWAPLIGSDHEFGCAPLESQSFDGSLYGWTLHALIDELGLCKSFVKEYFGIEAVGFAHRSRSITLDGVSANAVGQNMFEHVLTGDTAFNNLQTHVLKLSTESMNDYSRDWFGPCVDPNNLEWLIITVRKMYTESNSHVLLHRLLLEQLHRNRTEIWIAPVGAVANELSKIQSR